MRGNPRAYSDAQSPEGFRVEPPGHDEPSHLVPHLTALPTKKTHDAYVRMQSLRDVTT